jgi:hypothetical protein
MNLILKEMPGFFQGQALNHGYFSCRIWGTFSQGDLQQDLDSANAISGFALGKTRLLLLLSALVFGNRG